MKTESIYLKIGFLLVAIMLLTACPQKEHFKEPAGLSKFFISNHSEIDLYYGIGDKAIKIEPSGSKLIRQDGDIGVKAPLPSDGLGNHLRIYSDKQGTLIYEQDPIIDSSWLEDKQDNKYYGLVHYTLIISIDMLQ